MTANNDLLLDTHVWYRYQTSSHLIRATTANAIDRAVMKRAVFVSVISVWELAMLERANKLQLDGGVESWIQKALAKPGISLVPVSPEIAIESVRLPEPMHKDPADRFLVASARINRMTLVTADDAIKQFARTTGLLYLRAD